MQKRHRKIRAAVLAVALLTSSSIFADLKLEKYQEKLDGAPVEVFVITDDGQGAPHEWIAAPVAAAYPTAGEALPELASRVQLTAAVNANFYREDRPGAQEPIGLAVHEGKILSTPNSFYTSVGVIEGRLEWDNVKFDATVELEVAGKTIREKLCRYNGRASRGCASLWLNKAPANLKNAIFVTADGAGLSLGRKTYALQADAAGAWVLQWPNAIKAPPTKVSVDAKLKGARLGGKWQIVREAVSGSHIITAKKTYPSLARSWAIARQPRTMIGATADDKPFIAVFDGRRETSRGISIRAAWQFLTKKLGATWALNLDGGGSSTLLFEGRLVNKPSDGYPRPIAVGWGARPQAIKAE